MLTPVKVCDWTVGRQFDASFKTDGETVALWWSATGASFQNILKEVKSLEGARWNPEKKCWTFKHPSLSERNFFNLGHLTNGTFPGTKAGTLVNRYLKPAQIPPEPLRTTLRSHQRHMFREAVIRPGQIIAGETGVGKTLSMIELIEFFYIHPDGPKWQRDAAPVWVIAPISAQAAWQLEMKKWDCKVRPLFITNSANSLRSAMKLAKKAPRLVIADECQGFKTATSQRTKLMLELRRQMRREYGDNEFRMYEASGTPQPKNPVDWWSQCEIAQPGYLLERDAAALRYRVAVIQKEEGPHGTYGKITGWNVPEIQKLNRRLKGLVTVCLKKDCLDLPPKVYSIRSAPVTAEAKNAIQNLMHSCDNALTLLTRIRQLSDGFQPDATGDNLHTFDTPKDDLFKEYLEDLEDAGEIRSVAFAALTASVDKLTNIAHKAGWNVIKVDGRGWKYLPANPEVIGYPTVSHELLSLFQDLTFTEKLIYIANPGAGGVGVTLTASNNIVYYSNSFAAVDRMQSEDRIHRMGTRGATITDLLWLPTDQLILDNLKVKRDLQSLALGELVTSLKLQGLV